MGTVYTAKEEVSFYKLWKKDMRKAKKKSLAELLYSYFKRKRGTWVHSAQLEIESEMLNYKGSTGSRRLRELHEKGLIHRKLVKGIGKINSVVWYRIPRKA